MSSGYVDIKPRRATKAFMDENGSSLILEEGEIFVEFEGEIGTSKARFKVGDGRTTYPNLEYLDGSAEQVLMIC